MVDGEIVWTWSEDRASSLLATARQVIGFHLGFDYEIPSPKDARDLLKLYREEIPEWEYKVLSEICTMQEKALKDEQYRLQMERARLRFEGAMKEAGWLPMHDSIGVLYRWEHSETGRYIDNQMAFVYWFPAQ